MNRHERRAAKAQARAAGVDKGFEEYRAKLRQKYSANASDREIAEGYMRGEAWKASGADAMVLHPRGEPRSRRDDDLIVSARYDTFSFKAYIAPQEATSLIGDWENFITTLSPPDIRAATRSAVLEFLIEHRYVDGDLAAVLASMLIWLAVTSPAGIIFSGGKIDRNIHFEITDISDPQGRRGQNFRLMLITDESEANAVAGSGQTPVF